MIEICVSEYICAIASREITINIFRMSSYMFVIYIILKLEGRQVTVTHACNSSYSGGTDQEDECSKPAWANSLRKIKPITKKCLWSGSRKKP
jgi:hypothetical protein